MFVASGVNNIVKLLFQWDFARSGVCSYDENEVQCRHRVKSVTPNYSPSLFQHIGK